MNAALPPPRLPQDLVVDLDRTLVRADTLVEQFVALVFRRPLVALMLLGQLVRGRAAFKARLAALGDLDPARLPYRAPLLEYLRLQKAIGRRLHLVTAADQRWAETIADHCGIFTSARGSDGTINLKGLLKADHLVERFPSGFSYAGDSRADLKVWRRAQGIVLAGASPATSRAAARLGKVVEAEFARERSRLQTWPRALRLHQWAKNLLVFVPLVLSQSYRNASDVAVASVAFVALGLVASGTYLLNDLADLMADRGHPTKSSRPLAAGDLPVEHALVVAPLLLVLGLGVAATTSSVLLTGVTCYLCLTLFYTFDLKRRLLLDVVVLAFLYALRIMIGGEAIGAPHSVWLLTFSMFFFFSISLAKRYAEIASLQAAGAPDRLPRRGYRLVDAPVVLALGVSSSTASVLIVVHYLMEEAFPSNLYAQPNWLWAAPTVLTVWAARLWVVAGRGELHEDPVAFAIKDPFSWLAAAPLAVAFALAVLGWR